MNRLNFRKTVLLCFIFFACVTLWARDIPVGADAAPDLYSASMAGAGAFTTTTGGAPASAINPAQAGTAQRRVFDASALVIPGLGSDEGFMTALGLGALFPTRFGVFGSSLRFIGGDDFHTFNVGNTFGGNVFAAKEIYPGMSLGAGLNFGFGSGTTISGDLGFHYNTGSLGPLQNFTWAVVLSDLGLSHFPSWLTPRGGVSFDLVTVEGEEGMPNPFVLNVKADIGFPALFSFNGDHISAIFRAGLEAAIAERIIISTSWPGASGLNVRDMSNDLFQPLPSIGVAFNWRLPTGGERIAGGRLPSDGDIRIAAAFRPIYDGVTAMGGGVTWYVGLRDTTPPVITVDLTETVYFSPNNDGRADFLEIPLQITDDRFVTSWVLEIKDEQEYVVRVIENKEQRFETFNIRDVFSRLFSERTHIDIPNVITWDGRSDAGSLAPDGRYFFTITATDDSDNTAVSQIFETVIRITPPAIAINAMTETQRIFDPTGGGGHSYVTFTHNGSAEDAWISEIVSSANEVVRTFPPQSGSPGPIVWDGRNNAGQILPDGVFSYRISTTDRAQNSASAVMYNIILDSREAGAFLTSSVSAIRPAPNQTANLVTFTARVLLNDGIENWTLELKDTAGQSIRSFTGTGSVPSTIGWNGLDRDGAIIEGRFTPELTIVYTRGDVITTTATVVTVDISGPVLTFNATPEFFSPDNDGVEDELFIRVTAVDSLAIDTWSIEIREPEPPYNLFKRFEGRGAPAPQIIWDGRSEAGELVQSAMDYPFTFSAQDILGNASSIEGTIGVDVLVIRDGDRLRIQIPSIVFRPNFADFVGLDAEILDNNTRIIRRIAQILNRFRDYRVVVEGHANTTQPEGPGRDREQDELQRLSEARARVVVDLLVRYGVARTRLSYIGAGGSNPVVPFEDRDNWWKNRRVEFILIR